MERPFREFIYGMTRYEIVINAQRQAELVGKTGDIQALQRCELTYVVKKSEN